MVSYWIRDSLFGVSGAYWFGFSSGDGKGVMDPSTIHLSSHTFYCWIDCGDFLSSQSSDYPSMIQSKNTDPPPYDKINKRICIFELDHGWIITTLR